MDDKEKYWPKNRLSKDCFREFRKWFPELVHKIEFVEPIMHPENFCFSVSSESAEFGSISFDINAEEITVFTNFDHHHHETYIYDDLDEDSRIYEAICSALSSVKDMISGNEIIELEKKENVIIKAFRFHKDDPENKYSILINLEPESERLDSLENVPVERILLNWNGIVKKELLATPPFDPNSIVVKSENAKPKKKWTFWTAIKGWKP